MKEDNHWCIVCGKGYHACDSCMKEKGLAHWRAYTDSINHFKIFMVLKDYNNTCIDKAQARDLLAKTDLTGFENFKESSKNLIEEILKEDKKTSD